MYKRQQNEAPAEKTVAASAPMPDDDGGPSDDDDRSKRSRSSKSNKNKKKKEKKKKKKQQQASSPEPSEVLSQTDDTSETSGEDEAPEESDVLKTVRLQAQRDAKKRLVRLQQNQMAELEIRRGIMDHLTKVVDWRTYRLADTDPSYTIESARISRKKAKDIKGYVGASSNGKDQASIIDFLTRFAAACNQFKIPEGNAVWLFPEYMEGKAKSVVQRMIGAPANAESAGTSQLTTYISVVSRLINRYATDDCLLYTSDAADD